MDTKSPKFSDLKKLSCTDLKKMAKDMGICNKRSKEEYVNSIIDAFNEYEKYKKDKVDKYTKIKQLGNKGKEGVTYLVTDPKGREFAMKTFKKTKSSSTLRSEYNFQKKAASVRVSPRLVEYDTVSKYIVMEKMECHLTDLITKQKGNLTRHQQSRIIDIFNKLDSVGVFHGDSNMLNYMIKDDEIYIIDFGLSKEINESLIKKLNTSYPNIKIMTIGFILKLREVNCPSSSWSYLKKYVTNEDKITYQIN